MFTKLFFKVGMMLIIFFGLGSYASYITTGKVPFFNQATLSQLQTSVMGKVEGAKGSIARAKQTIKPEATSQPTETVMFKWRDSQTGELSFGDTPPEDAVEVEQLGDLSGRLSVVDLPESRPQDRRLPSETSRQISSGAESKQLGNEPINPYSPSGAKQLIEKAQGIEDQLKQRDSAQKQALKGL